MTALATTRVPARGRSTGGRDEVLRASVVAVCRRSFLLPSAGAAALGALGPALLDGPDLLTTLRWVGVLLACGLLACVDDPGGEVLAASPYPRRVRLGARLAVGLAAASALWAVAAGLVQWREPGVPVLPVTLETLALGSLGVALAAGLQAWREVLEPSPLAALGLVALVVAAHALPRWYALEVTQTWGPPWWAAHLRWTAVALLGLAVLSTALRDPLDR